MAQNVAVRMRIEAHVRFDLDTTKDELPARFEPVNVVPDTHSIIVSSHGSTFCVVLDLGHARFRRRL